MHKLQAYFDSGQRYGRAIDWMRYMVYDAACVLIRYLYQLPDSLIPRGHVGRLLLIYHPHEASHHPSANHSVSENKSNDAITALKTVIQDLLPLHRHSLLYLIDILSAIALRCEVNKMTAQAIATIFQHCILQNCDQEAAVNIISLMIERSDDLTKNSPDRAL